MRKISTKIEVVTVSLLLISSITSLLVNVLLLHNIEYAVDYDNLRLEVSVLERINSKDEAILILSKKLDNRCNTSRVRINKF